MPQSGEGMQRQLQLATYEALCSLPFFVGNSNMLLAWIVLLITCRLPFVLCSHCGAAYVYCVMSVEHAMQSM